VLCYISTLFLHNYSL